MPKEQNGWTLIEPGKKDETVEIVNVDDDDDFEEEEDTPFSQDDDQQQDEEDDSDDDRVVNDSDDNLDDDDEDDKEEQKPRKSNNKRKRGERAQRRIRDLVSKNKALEVEVLKAREESTEARNTASSERKRAVEVAKTSLESKLEGLEANLTKATDDGDTAQILRISRQLSETESSLKELKSIKIPDPVEVQTELKSKTAPTTEQKQPSREDLLSTLPEYGQDWIEDNPEFWDDTKFRTRAMGYGQILEAEGYDPQSQEYWDELGNKMSGQEKPAQKRTRRRSKRRTPSGGGSSRVTKSSNNKTIVKLSNEEITLAKRLGISKEAYAKRVVEHEENTNSKNGYTTIDTSRRV